MRADGIKTYYAATRSNWRNWLIKNHLHEKAVWLIIYKKSSAKESVTYKEAVKEALCFGWIDSKPNKRDEESYFQYFSQRNPRSNWSKVNKEIIEELTVANLMYPKGEEMVALAKETGTWDALNAVENLVVPPDLEHEFAKYTHARSNFEAFPRSVKRSILEWIYNAKRPATRLKRVQETATLAEKNERANQYRK